MIFPCTPFVLHSCAFLTFNFCCIHVVILTFTVRISINYKRQCKRYCRLNVLSSVFALMRIWDENVLNRHVNNLTMNKMTLKQE